MNFGPDPFPYGGGGGFSFNFMFTLVPILFVIIFAVVIISMIVRGARYAKNASSPRDSRYAKVVSKRMEVRNHSHNMNDSMHHSSRTYYYITLEFDNGQRQEYLDVKNLYGLVVEGDVGYAAIQGDWIVAFERNAGQGQSGSRF